MHAEQAERRPNLHDDVHELFRVLGRIRWRLGLEQTLLFTLRGLMFSAAGLFALSLGAWLIAAPDILSGYAWVTAVPVVVALVGAVLRWPTDRQAALAADRRLTLHERLGTAVEVAQHPTGRFDRVQIQDALVTARAAPTSALPLDERVRRAALVAAALLVLAAASMLLGNVPRPAILAPDESVALTDAAAPSDLVDRSVPDDASVLALAETQPVQQTQPDANLSARVQQEQAESDALDKLSQALDRVSAAQPAADSIRQGDFSQARDQLTNLGQEADQLSDAAKQQLARALQQASAQTAATDRQLADRERQAGQALGRTNYNDQRQALNALADQVERSGTRAAPSDQLARDAGLLQQQAASKGQGQQPAVSPGTGNSAQGQSATSDGAPGAPPQQGASGGPGGAGAAGQQSGPGIGDGANPDAVGDQSSRLDSAGQSVEVPTKLGSGPGVRPPTGAEDQTGTDPTTGARSVSELVQAQQTGQVTPEQNLVPGEQRPVVRGYFR